MKTFRFSKALSALVVAAMLTATFVVSSSSADAQVASPTPEGARSVCELDGVIEVDVIEAQRGDIVWVSVDIPANAILSVDIIHHKGVHQRGNWTNHLRSFRRNDDGTAHDGLTGFGGSSAPFYWGNSSPFVVGQPLGDFLSRDDTPIISRLPHDGGEYLISAEHLTSVFISEADSPSSWRVQDFTVHLEDGTSFPLCSDGNGGAGDGFDENGKPLNPLPNPEGTVGEDFQSPSLYDPAGVDNDPAFPLCAISTEFGQGPCFASFGDRITYLQEQVVADGCFGHVWIGGFDEPLVVQ